MTYEKLKKLWAKFSDKEYRHAYLSSAIGQTLSTQIYYLRTRENWSQYDLAEKAHMKQPQISRLEKTCENVSLATLKKIASAFDVALVIKFVPFSKAVKELATENLDQTILNFNKDRMSAISIASSSAYFGATVEWKESISAVKKSRSVSLAIPTQINFISGQIASKQHMESLNA